MPYQLELMQECFAEGRKPLLLFPGDDSITLDQEEDDSNEVNDITLSQLQKEHQLLILIDGTWAEAKRMLLQSPELVDNSSKYNFNQRAIQSTILYAMNQKNIVCPH
jgi:DTW domain-containing protein YfiP